MQEKVFITKRTLREFGFIFGVGLPLIIGWLIPSLFGHEPRIWTLYIGISTVILAILFPNILKLPYVFWIKIGLILGWINSRIILGIVFFLILIPISIIMKFFKYDPLNKKQSSNKSTYRELVTKHNVDLTKIF